MQTPVSTWKPGGRWGAETSSGAQARSYRETLERIFRMARQHPEDLNWTVGPGEIAAAAAVVAAGLPAGEAVMREIARWTMT